MAAPVSADAIGRARAWVFTWNNYTHTVLFPDGLPAGIKYCIYSAEKGADGTPHLQGYIVFNEKKMLGGIRKIVCKTVEGVIFKPFETAHLAIAKGDAKATKRTARRWTRHTSLDRGSSANCQDKEHAWTSRSGG